MKISQRASDFTKTRKAIDKNSPPCHSGTTIKKKTKQIKIRVPLDWIREIERRCELEGIPIEPGRGHAGGVTQWVRQLVATELGEDKMNYYHPPQAPKGRPNPAHPVNIRLWLACERMRTPGGQFGFVLPGADFMSNHNLTRTDFVFLCEIGRTPADLFKDKTPGRSRQWSQWSHVVAELHGGNNLGLEPGFYKTPITVNTAIATYGRESFIPTTLDEDRMEEISVFEDAVQATILAKGSN